MFANLIEDIIDAAAGTDHDYDLRYTQKVPGGYESLRYDVASAQDKPATLKISHVETGKGDGLYRNTLVRFDAVLERSEDQVQGTQSVYLVIRTPVKVATATDTTKLLYQMYDFLATAGYQAKLVAGEI